MDVVSDCPRQLCRWEKQLQALPALTHSNPGVLSLHRAEDNFRSKDLMGPNLGNQVEKQKQERDLLNRSGLMAARSPKHNTARVIPPGDIPNRECQWWHH